MKELYLPNEPSIGKVTLPTGERATWFYNPEVTTIARFATKVIFHSNGSCPEYAFILLLSGFFIDRKSIKKITSVARDLTLSEMNKYTPIYSNTIFNIQDCKIER